MRFWTYYRRSGSYWLSNIPAALMVQPNIFNFWKQANHGRLANTWLFSQQRPSLSMTRVFSEFRVMVRHLIDGRGRGP